MVEGRQDPALLPVGLPPPPLNGTHWASFSLSDRQRIRSPHPGSHLLQSSHPTLSLYLSPAGRKTPGRKEHGVYSVLPTC